MTDTKGGNAKKGAERLARVVGKKKSGKVFAAKITENLLGSELTRLY